MKIWLIYTGMINKIKSNWEVKQNCLKQLNQRGIYKKDSYTR